MRLRTVHCRARRTPRGRDVLTRVGLNGRGASYLDHTFCYRPDISVIFMLGNEATGLPNSWLHVADLGLSIPMADDRKGSLNVAVAAAIVLHHAFTSSSQNRVMA